MYGIVPYSRVSASPSARIQPAMKARLLLAVAVLSTLNPQLSTVFAQGNLTPPGAPAPTMKTLSQIETRTAISSLPFVITNAGSYYVTANLTGTVGQSGITISASGVEVDLRGFELAGVPGALAGVRIS